MPEIPEVVIEALKIVPVEWDGHHVGHRLRAEDGDAVTDFFDRIGDVSGTIRPAPPADFDHAIPVWMAHTNAHLSRTTEGWRVEVFYRNEFDEYGLLGAWTESTVIEALAKAVVEVKELEKKD